MSNVKFPLTRVTSETQCNLRNISVPFHSVNFSQEILSDLNMMCNSTAVTKIKIVRFVRKESGKCVI